MLPTHVSGERRTGIFLSFLLKRLTSRAHRRIQYFLVSCWLIFVFYCGLQFKDYLAKPPTVHPTYPPYVRQITRAPPQVITPASLNKEPIKISAQNPISSNEVIPIVIFAYQRHEYLQKCLATLYKYMPAEGFQIFVSQDGNHDGVANVARSFSKVTLFQRERNIILPTVQNPGNPNYYAIAQHYKFGFEQVFRSNPSFKRVIVLEEDIEIAPDFFDYFSALAPILDNDPKLYCVSAWNDNGLRHFVEDPEALYRSDFFPGLGWMMTRKLWDEIHDDWPLGFWDDWLRESTVRKGRACIRPEISRTYTFGASGVSNGQFFGQYLQHIKLNTEPIKWHEKDLSYLQKDVYDANLIKMVDGALSIHVDNREEYADKNMDLKMFYSTAQDFESIGAKIGVMNELKAGVPRGAYGGVVSFRWKSNRMFIVPQSGPMKPITYLNEPPYRIG